MSLMMVAGRVTSDEHMQWDGTANDLPGVDGKQAIGLVRNLPERSQVVEHFVDRLRLAHRDDVGRHEPADRALVIVARIAQPGSVLGRQRLRHLLDDVLGGLTGEKREVVGVERAQHRHHLVAVELLEQRAASGLAGFDDGGSCLIGLELSEDQQPIAPGQRIEDRRDVRGMLGLQVPLQLDEILSVLHLLEQVVSRGLLPARERGQHAMTVE